jgi:lipopolysaccharide/colanic/teichoic acid biosynthesis glycosyltransferase
MVNEVVPARQGARLYTPVRRLADAAVAGTALFLALPLMVVIGIAIRWESRGPVFERDVWVTRGGRRFTSFKFRTGFDDRASAYRSSAARLTRVGEFLHYTRIEYLPELINVARGELSLHEPSAQPRLLAD